MTEEASRQSKAVEEKRIWLYAFLALGSFICALVLIGLMLWNVALLSRFGLTGNFYYLILLPLGLAVAAFLFGALRSWAHYSGKALGGALDLTSNHLARHLSPRQVAIDPL